MQQLVEEIWANVPAFYFSYNDHLYIAMFSFSGHVKSESKALIFRSDSLGWLMSCSWCVFCPCIFQDQSCCTGQHWEASRVPGMLQSHSLLLPNISAIAHTIMSQFCCVQFWSSPHLQDIYPIAKVILKVFRLFCTQSFVPKLNTAPLTRWCPVGESLWTFHGGSSVAITWFGWCSLALGLLTLLHRLGAGFVAFKTPCKHYYYFKRDWMT